MLFDTHAHYDARRFDSDRHELLGSMQQNGVGRILNAGCDLESSRAAIELAHQYDFLYAAVGSHPDDADHVDGALVDTYRELAKEEKVVAIGEIGLDYYYEDVPREQQKKAFRMQMELARELNLPVIVHERDAHGDGMEIVRDFPDVTGVFHCYSGSLEMARELVKLGWYVGFTGVLTFKTPARRWRWRKMCPCTAFCWKPTAPIWPRSPTGASAATPPCCPVWRKSWPSCGTKPWRKSNKSPGKMAAAYSV